jgi:hypothetical protein
LWVRKLESLPQPHNKEKGWTSQLKLPERRSWNKAQVETAALSALLIKMEHPLFAGVIKAAAAKRAHGATVEVPI